MRMLITDKPCVILLHATAAVQATVLDMKSVLEGHIRRAENIAAAFAHFKREVCLAAEHSKTGRPVGEKVLQAMEATGEVWTRGTYQMQTSSTQTTLGCATNQPINSVNLQLPGLALQCMCSAVYVLRHLSFVDR